MTITFPLKDGIKTRLLIAETGNSLRSYAKKISVSHTYLSQVLNGIHNPSPTVAYKIANGLGLKIEDIFLTKNVDEIMQICK